MAHPLIPQILDLAAPVAQSLGLEVVTAVFHTHQSPPVLRVDVRNQEDDTGLEDCEQMSRALEAALDESNLIPDAYVLEVSSPGIPNSLTTDREFTSFRGFPVIVTTSEPFNHRAEWSGNLVRRDEDAVHINLKGRSIAIPRSLVKTVHLADGEE
ncbi:MAG: ribosome maturation factor RimP [Myxacorys chilensis ATA2-1-KO14]|jgi:ribosome maturation factor RimP|nr:ribosome maturation factor RimP [Myxacorys chilensis ATA2-1-KO14]